MGNSIESYRAAIGLFHNHGDKTCGAIDFRADSYQSIFTINLQCNLFVSLLIRVRISRWAFETKTETVSLKL